MKENGKPVDLDSKSEGDGLAVELKPGPNTFEVPMSLDSSGAQRYEAVFEPDAASADGVSENKKGAASVLSPEKDAFLLSTKVGLKVEVSSALSRVAVLLWML